LGQTVFCVPTSESKITCLRKCRRRYTGGPQLRSRAGTRK
jgi:hypothetical protein